MSDDDNESLARLMKLAGERPEIPLSVESRIYHRVQQEWQIATAAPNGEKVYKEVHKTWRRGSLRAALLRWTLPLGVAASAAIAVFMLTPPDATPLQTVATVSRVVGAGALNDRYATGAKVYSGDTISTGPDEGLSLLLARSESLRIDANTEIRIDAANQFTLLSGRIYADSGQFVYRDGGLVIETGFGRVTDVGTQFSVSTTDDSLEVAVREGRVDVQNEQAAYAAKIGERLTLRSGEAAVVADLDTHDAYWDWAADMAPTLDLTNKSLLDFLKWAARETGRELQFASDELRMFAMRTDVHGSIEGMTPDEALVAILASTTVHYRIENTRILIET
jgi:ferric-dicitrate binding protein FerR (iron transport regulator)